MNVCSLISVVIPCFNAAAFLEGAVRSIFAQETPGTEILIVGMILCSLSLYPN